MEPLPWEKPQIHGHWVGVLGHHRALVLPVLQGMLQGMFQVLQGTLQVLQGMLQVLQEMLQVLQEMLQVLQGMAPVLLVFQDAAPALRDTLPVLQDRSPERRGTPGSPREPAAGSPSRASPGAGGQRGSGWCWWAERRITGDREESRTVRLGG